MLVPFDLLATGIAMVVMILVGMRLLYGAWPWESHKTWYHTRGPVEYVVALKCARRAWSARQVSISETLNTANSPLMSDGSAEDFDRSLLAVDDSPVASQIGAHLTAAFERAHD